MKKEDFDIRIFAKRLSLLLNETDENTYTLAKKLSLTPATISRYANGLMAPKVPTLYAMADIFDVNPLWLLGFDAPRAKQPESKKINLPPPNITENYTTFPVIVEVAAGFEHIVMEDWEGDTVDISNDYLKGRDKSEFFVIRVKGDSMYPEYQDGDRVLILKQPTVNYSGQVGVVMYDDELGTLKKVEYKQGENWMRLVAINPSYAPKKIENEDLNRCRILGIPKLIIREVEE